MTGAAQRGDDVRIPWGQSDSRVSSDGTRVLGVFRSAPSIGSFELRPYAAGIEILPHEIDAAIASQVVDETLSNPVFLPDQAVGIFREWPALLLAVIFERPQTSDTQEREGASVAAGRAVGGGAGCGGGRTERPSVRDAVRGSVHDRARG